jgi:uncharacterized protein
MNVWILAIVVFAVAVVMTMTGRGGGNYYVLAIALSGYAMNDAATTGQFILIVSSLTATVFFGKQRVTDWKLVLLIGSMTLVSAFVGGLISDRFDDRWLKTIFAVFVAGASVLMLRPVRKHTGGDGRFVYLMRSGEQNYRVNLPLVIPVVLLTGFISGMVGISGGSFLVPLMILAIHVPMRIAVGTSTALVTVTASAGFLGHLSSGHCDPALALPLAAAGLVGGLIGAALTLKSQPKNLKVLFAGTSLTAAVIMIVSALR